MKKYKILSTCLLAITFILVCPTTVFANSSWRWISETRPYDILPLVILLTLAIEISAIYFIAKISPLSKVMFWVILANIFSFISPYLFLYILPDIDGLYTFEQMLEHTGFYTIGITYLFITIAVELPTLFFTLRKHTAHHKILLSIIIGANIATTVITAVVERVICFGKW